MSNAGVRTPLAFRALPCVCTEKGPEPLGFTFGLREALSRVPGSPGEYSRRRQLRVSGRITSASARARSTFVPTRHILSPQREDPRSDGPRVGDGARRTRNSNKRIRGTGPLYWDLPLGNLWVPVSVSLFPTLCVKRRRRG